LRYLYCANAFVVLPKVDELLQLPRDAFDAVFKLFEITTNYGAKVLKRNIIAYLTEAIAPNGGTRHYIDPSLREKSPEMMTAAQFVESRGDLIRLMYCYDTPGMEELRKNTIKHLQTGWLPDLMKLEGMLEILRDCGQLGIDLFGLANVSNKGLRVRMVSKREVFVRAR
jgi:hypothetical protein